MSHMGIWIFEEIWGLSVDLGFLKLSLHVINLLRHYLPLIFLVAFNSLFRISAKYLSTFVLAPLMQSLQLEDLCD